MFRRPYLGRLHWAARLKTRPQQHRSMAGGGGGASSDSLYGRLMQKYPLQTSAVTAMTLWGGGDAIAQGLEMREDPHASFQVNRFAGVATHGAIMGGVGSYFWYNALEKFTATTLKLASGSARFVFAKISLEIIIWHQISLAVYWFIVGTFEGHSVEKIMKELRTDYLPTLFADVSMWTPIDILNFKFVPLQLQVLFINLGSLVEAVALSYIHKHGFGGAEGGSSKHDVIQEQRSTAASRVRLPFIDKLLKIERHLSSEQLQDELTRKFAALDVDKDNCVFVDDLKGADGLLPGVTDAAVNQKISELLHRLADRDGDGKVSVDEYRRMLSKMHDVGFRRSFVIDVVVAAFDTNGDGQIDSKEMKNVLRVYGETDFSDAAVDAMMKFCDRNKDGKVSADELRAALLARELAIKDL